MRRADRAPLAGVRVVNLGLHVAGPLTALLLEGAGAEICHVLPPEALLPHKRLPALMCGRHHLRLDLKTAEARTRLSELLSQADVLIEGFRPGVMTRLGVNLEDCRVRYPRLVTCSIPGFAKNDLRADAPGWEGAILAAAAALFPVIADAKANGGMELPQFPATPIASNFAGLIASIGIVAALIERDRSGSGQGIEISLFDAMFEAIGDVGTWLDDAGPDRNLRDRFGGGTYQCSDGRWIQFNTQNPEFLRRLHDRAALADELPDIARLTCDPSYHAELKRRMAFEFSRHPSDWWEKIGLEAHIALIICRTLAEWRQSAHARAAEIVSPRGDPIPPSPGIRFLRSRQAGGRQTNASLREKKADSSYPLAHIRVVDVAHYLAGPTAARVLAQLGANVCKLIDPGQRNLHKHYYVNRGKNSVLCDLGHVDGQATLRRLLQRSEVFIHNFLPSSLQKLNLESDVIRSINPDIVYASVSAYGENGEFSGRPGYETQGQAVSGMMLLKNLAQPVLHPFPVNDYGTGLTTAFGIVCSLFSISDKGIVHDVDGSLARTATLFQACVPSTEASSSPGGATGESWFDRTTHLQVAARARDQWICISGPGSDICKPLGLSSASGEEQWPLDRIAEAIGAYDLSHWKTQYSHTKVCVCAVAELTDIMRDAESRRRGVVSIIENPELGTLTVPEPGLRFSRSTILIGAPHTPPGSHANEILALIGNEPSAGQS